MDRRVFLTQSLCSAAGLALASPVWAAPPNTDKNILILGGTWFLGPAAVEAALVAGYNVTLFNRGISSPELFPYVEKLRGYRSADADEQDLSALGRRHWDAVIDVWPNDPDVVASAAEHLKGRTKHYLYVSSVAAYPGTLLEGGGPPLDEQAATLPWVPGTSSYNRRKAESERRVHAAIGESLTIVRPGPIKGARDDSPELLTWLRRLQANGPHIAPGDGSDPLEMVDVKDVARFLMLAIERSLYGTYNLTGRSMTFREFLRKCGAAVHSDADLVWIPKSFLDEHQLEREVYFPYWRPSGSLPGLYQISSEKAYRAGWQTRSFDETAFDCLADFRSHQPPVSTTTALIPWSDRLSPEKEREVIDAWHSSHA